MFDSVLDRQAIPRGRLASGATVSVIAHVLAIAGVIYISSRPQAPTEKDVDVTFFAAAPPPPPPPPPPPAGGGAPKANKVEVKPRPVIKKDVIVEAPKDQKPPEPEPSKPDPSVGQPGGQEGGQVGGQVGGTVGGTVGGQIGGQLGGQLGGQVGGTGTSGVIPFGAGMTRPSQPRVVYTPSATVARVEGVMIVRCVIMATGSIQNCRVIKPLPHFDNVVQQLQSQRITPLTFQGRPVNVEYTWTFKMKMP